MFQVDSFISFHDLSPHGHFLWSSSSITDILGYDPEEVLGLPAYEFLHPEDIPLTRVTHHENILNDLVASQIVLRFMTKEGTYVTCLCIFSLCYDFILNCCQVIDREDGAYKQIRAHSAAMTRLAGSRKEEFARIKRHHEAFQANSWNPNFLAPELRTCVILNRFARNLAVMYASPSIGPLLNVDPEMIMGKPFLLFIRADDLASFVEQVDMAKSSNMIMHMRFWFQSPNSPEEIPCEAMIFGSSDGMVAVLRRCKPFMRKRLIQDRGAFEYRSVGERRPPPSFGISSSAPNSASKRPTAFRTTASRTPYSHFPEDRFSTSPSTTASSSSSSPPTPSPPTPSGPTRAAMEGTRKMTCPLTQLPQGSINCIRNLDQEKTRPLTLVSASEVDEHEMAESENLLRRIHIQEFSGEDEDSSSSHDL
ncbi:hypothetical protein EMPS_03073 [Entomortierella parvispora]|uniref:PAS domain-containing protein n=1 Tax=Entomortierella parvispora TaxID=205924 RepID=A0A9P3H6L2_9FUNG|nr:hypothetical protein EMPS_03073 [Entomortierella parvispora]